MSRRDKTRRGWTHRRLGIGTTGASEAALAETDALLTLIGARGRTTSATLGADLFGAALLDYTCDLDLVAGIAATDAAPVGAELLRLTRPPVRRRMLTWKLLIPAMSGGLAAIIVAITLVVVGGRGSSQTLTPSLSATAESRQLLQHAHTLLAAAANAVPGQRTRLYTEARADLRHVSQLLPLAPPPARPAIRNQLRTLRKRVPPPPQPRQTPAKASGSSQQGTAIGEAGGGGTTIAPPRGQEPKSPPVDASVTHPPPQGEPGRLPPQHEGQRPQQPGTPPLSLR